MDNRALAERYAQALRDSDPDETVELAHPNIVVTYPQSGEVIRGRDNYEAMLRNYPSGVPIADDNVTVRSGGEQTVSVSSPLPFGMPTITSIGGGNTFIIEGTAHYSDSGVFNVVMILRMLEGKVIDETSYFAAPFDPPDWRRPYVEA